MTQLLTKRGVYSLLHYESEAEFETDIVKCIPEIFREDRIYLDVKKRIGKGQIKNIPDAFLIDLSRGDKPTLFVVENELASHDPFKHIGVQLLEFAVSYKTSGVQLKKILIDEISKNKKDRVKCQAYAKDNGFRNVDHLIEYLINDTDFQALVIIDEDSDDLREVIKNFSFPVEVVVFTAYKGQKGERIYRFSRFLEDVEESIPPSTSRKYYRRDISGIDTIVVPAREEGFKEVFLGQNCWYKIRIHSSIIPQLKYIASYQVAPESAITHVAKISKIERYKNTGKYIVYFEGKAKKIKPIRMIPKGRVRGPQGSRYTTWQKLKKARTLEEAF